MKVKIYTDGACSGNPGKGGWAAIILDSNLRQSSVSGSESNTTIHSMSYFRRYIETYFVLAYIQWTISWIGKMDLRTDSGNT